MSGPSRLTMIHENMCRTCGNIDKCHTLRTEMLYGWYFCENCKYTVRNEAKQHMIQSIPLHGVLTKYDPIIFYRTNGAEWVGIIDPTEFCMGMTLVDGRRTYLIKIVFNADNNEMKTRFEYTTNSQKHIDIQTIYEHNPSIYFSFIKCNNLFDNSLVQIGYDELDDEIKQIIRYERPYRVIEGLLDYVINDIANIVSVYLFNGRI